MTPTRAKLLLLLSEPRVNAAVAAVRSGPRSCEAQYKARLKTFKKQIPAPPSISSRSVLSRGVPSRGVPSGT